MSTRPVISGVGITEGRTTAPCEWSVFHTPAAAAQATATQEAPGANKINVVSSISFSIASDDTVTPAILNCYVIDGATGGTTYLWKGVISIPATAGSSDRIVLSGLHIPGTANTATTIEFDDDGGTNTVESVSMTGYVLS